MSLFHDSFFLLSILLKKRLVNKEMCKYFILFFKIVVKKEKSFERLL